MLTKSIRKYLQNQYVAGFSATLLVMVSGASFAWVSPILHLLNKEKYQNVLIPMTSTEISWMVSLIEIGSLFSPLLSGILSDCFGRKLSIVFVGPFLIAGWGIVLMTRDAFSLYIVRVLHGFAMGALFTTVPMYLGEIAEAKVRGGLTSLLQTLWYTGFLLQYIVGSYMSYDNSALFNLILSTTVFLFFGIFQPESPYYLTVKKRDEKACKSLMLLRGKSSMNDVESEIQNIRDCVEKDMTNKVKWSDALKLSRIDLKILLIVQALAVFRLGSGTISIATYVSEILLLARWDYLSVEVAMTIYGIVTLSFIIIAMLCVDSLGRRPLLILSCLGTGICTLLLGVFFLLDTKKSIDLESIRWGPMLVLICYSMFFAIGLGPVTQTIQSELFPTNMRALGNIVTAYVLTFVSFFCLRFYQVICDILGVYGNFFIFSFISFTGAIYVYLYLPETKGKTFLEISEFFSGKKETMPVKNPTNTKL